jgi:predicted AlkP superfamily pyrophosphatase or phosphodiesterase
MIDYNYLRRSFIRIIFLLILIISCQSHRAENSKRNAKKIVLISVDGFRPDFYLSSNFKTPFLKSLKESGSFAQGMISVFPSVTYPNHTTLVTGKYPSEHGILSNVIFDKKPTTQWYWDGRRIKSETLWSLLKENKLKTASLHWPVTQNLDIDFMVPEIFKAPPWHTDASFELASRYANPRDLPKKINKRLSLKPYTNMKEADTWAFKAFKEIYTSKKPDFFALHIIYADKNQHESGRDSDQTKNAIQWIDENLKDISSVLDAQTCLIILGDHGFMNYQKKIHMNALFYKKGWIELTEDKKEIKSWKVVSHKSGGQAAIYLSDDSIKDEVIAFLKENQSLGYQYVSKSQLDKMKTYPNALAAISAKDGFNVGLNLSGSVIERLKKTQGQHGQLPDQKKMHTGLLMHNCDLNKQDLGIVKNLQITPTILNLFGIQASKNMQEAIQ